MSDEERIEARTLSPSESVPHLREAFLERGWPKDSADMRTCILTLTSAIFALADAVDILSRGTPTAAFHPLLKRARESANEVMMLGFGIEPDGQ